MNKKKWIQILALTLSLPSAILSLFYVADLLVKSEILSRNVAMTGALAIPVLLLFVIVFRATSKKR
jgi:hypothetical protein